MKSSLWFDLLCMVWLRICYTFFRGGTGESVNQYSCCCSEYVCKKEKNLHCWYLIFLSKTKEWSFSLKLIGPFPLLCLELLVKLLFVFFLFSGSIFSRVEEDYLWRIKQLGCHSPLVLLNTLFYFNTKYFGLTTVEQHLRLSFATVYRHWKQNPLTMESKACLRYQVSSLCGTENEGTETFQTNYIERP